jgi:formylglycine-generating enzyme required for sulfatase activity
MKPTAPIFLAVLLPFLLFACGGDQSALDDKHPSTGSVLFDLAWQGSAAKTSSIYRSPSGDVCSDYRIDSIRATIYAADDGIAASETADCAQHSLTLTGIEAASGYRMVVEGLIADDRYWQGEAAGITVTNGGTTDVGTITMTYRGLDDTAPVVTSTEPVDGAIAVPLNTTLRVTFSEPIVPASLGASTFTLCDDGAQDDGAQLDCYIAYDAETFTATITPVVPLQQQTVYRATILVDQTPVVEDLAGIPMQAAYSWQLSTALTCTDADMDDYYLETGCGTELDCNDDDDTIHPQAVEACNDETDNDCDGDMDCNDADCIDAIECNPVITNSVGMTFNLIQPGTFTMGSPPEELERFDDEAQHQVTLTQPFYLQATEVTQGQWEALMGSNPSYFNACGTDCPVESVSWEDAQDFINALNELNEGTYRLPTEAEWEYACRAGSTTAFANGDITVTGCARDPNLDLMGWYCYNAESTPHPVAQKNPNDWGLYDMHGNVWEWCQDWYGDYPTDPVTDPTGPETGASRVYRGGSWKEQARLIRSALRNRHTDTFDNNLGLRLVRVP